LDPTYHREASGDEYFFKIDTVLLNIMSGGVGRDESSWSGGKGEIKIDPKGKGISI
jgi:hypothetical protein